MAIDMKESIADAAKKLLIKKRVSRLTVKDIVDECGITRQAFYYHFEDIPALIRWILDQETEQVISEYNASDDEEIQLRYLFVMATQAIPYLKKGLSTNYRDELERILSQHIQLFFERMCEEKGLYQSCTVSEVKLILRYHSQAIFGLLRHWTEADTRNLDQIVHTVFRLMTEGISPLK